MSVQNFLFLSFAGVIIGFLSGMYVGVKIMKINIRKLRESRERATIAGLEWEPVTDFPEDPQIPGINC